MKLTVKERKFWEEILEIIPCGVSLRTFLPETPDESENKADSKESETTQSQRNSEERRENRDRGENKKVLSR